MQKPSERHNFTSDNNIIKFKKPVHDPFKTFLENGIRFSILLEYKKHISKILVVFHLVFYFDL